MKQEIDILKPDQNHYFLSWISENLISLDYFSSLHQPNALSIPQRPLGCLNGTTDTCSHWQEVWPINTPSFPHGSCKFSDGQLLCILDTFCSIYCCRIHRPSVKSKYWLRSFACITDKSSASGRSGRSACLNNLLRWIFRRTFCRRGTFCHFPHCFWTLK